MIKQIAFKNSRGNMIKGVLKEKNVSSPLFIVCHGYKSSSNHPGLVGITNKLYEMGDATFAFNFSRKSAFDLRGQVADIDDVITHFGKKRKMILLGASFGALNCAIAASSRTTRLEGLVTVNGFFGGWQLGLDKLVQYVVFLLLCLFKKSYRDSWRYLQDNLRPEEIKTKTLVIHARHDNAVSSRQSQEFFQKVSGKKEFYLLENADHHLTADSSQQETAETIDRWLKRNKL